MKDAVYLHCNRCHSTWLACKLPVNPPDLLAALYAPCETCGADNEITFATDEQEDACKK